MQGTLHNISWLFLIFIFHLYSLFIILLVYIRNVTFFPSYSLLILIPYIFLYFHVYTQGTLLFSSSFIAHLYSLFNSLLFLSTLKTCYFIPLYSLLTFIPYLIPYFSCLHSREATFFFPFYFPLLSLAHTQTDNQKNKNSKIPP